MPRPQMAALGFEVLFGALTITGSFMAFGKLQEFLPGRPLTFRGQNVLSIGLFLAGVASSILAAPAPRCFHGPMPASTAGSSFCVSRIPTWRALRRRLSRRFWMA